MRYAVVGAGMAGLACAEELSRSGDDVMMYDKARGPGGRMSTRRAETPLGTVRFDHGAQYFTARTSEFIARVALWEQRGLVAKWPAAGAEAWVGVPSMNSPVRDMTSGQVVRWESRVERLSRTDSQWHLHGDGLPSDAFDGIVVALPAEQATALLQPWDNDFAACAKDTVSAPCWTVMVAFALPLPTKSLLIAGDAVIGWAALNTNKPGRTGPSCWVIQSDQDWSNAHLNDSPDDVIAALMRRFASCLKVELPEPLYVAAHLWRYARSGNAARGALFNPDLYLGVCGDWLLGPRVECAWLSGTQLAQKIIASR